METTSRVIIVTGANKGIGYALMQRLAKHAPRYTLILTSRDETLGKEAVTKLINLEPKSKESLNYHQLDINSEESREKFKDWVEKTFGKFDVLINNAAVAIYDAYINKDYAPTVKSTETVIQTNYHSTRALTEKLIPLLSPDGKIINVSSAVGKWSLQGEAFLKIFTNPDFEDKDLENAYNTYRDAVVAGDWKEKGFVRSEYRFSKALMNAWNYYVLPKNLSGDQQCIAMTPGPCKTDLGVGTATRTADDGADTIEWLIVDIPFKFDKEVNGKFFEDRKISDFV